MKGRFAIAISCVVSALHCIVGQFIPINFSEAPLSKVGDHCRHHLGGKGNCQTVHNCPDIFDSLKRNEVSYIDVRCDESINGYDLVCCLPEAAPFIDISPPYNISSFEFVCGYTWYPGSTDLATLYDGNTTAQTYKDLGYDVNNLDMSYDSIRGFAFTKDNVTDFYFHGQVYASIGGENARTILTSFIVLLGTPEKWLCDGALINERWILTAAHCFDQENPTIVRLGEYDLDSSNSWVEHPIDFSMERIVVYPDYRFPSSQHDLALIKLKENIPQLRLQNDITPVCLPWGDESSVDLVGQTVTLTGWGAKIFLGPSSPILQEVNVTVFDSAVCDASYSRLSDYRDKFPNGITKNTAVCAGDEQGGKDACQGDSGGPIVYKNKEGQFVLAGIVSTGNGCGLKEFPGIYAPVHNPHYLAWIKKVAFLEA